MLFNTFSREKIDLVAYVSKYITEHPNVEILVGCDSQNNCKNTVYAVVVGLYNIGCGVHIIFKKFKTKKESTTQVRLINEVWTSIEVAEELRKNGCSVKYIDIDVNPNPKYKSHDVFNQVVGMCEGMGYRVRYKHMAPLVTTMADAIARH